MADYKERDSFPEVPDYKINIGDNLDGGPLSTSDIYSPKSEPALIDNVLDPSEDMLKEIVVLIDEFGKKTLKKSFTKELRVGNSVGATTGTNASVLKNEDGEFEEDKNKGGRVEKIAPLLAGVLAGSVLSSDDGEPKKSKSEFGMCSKGHSHKDQEDFDLCAKAEATSESRRERKISGSFAWSRPSDREMPPPGLLPRKKSPEAAVIKSINKFLKG